jgi:histidinol-phosphate aminotransferase
MKVTTTELSMPKIQPQPGIMDIEFYQAGSSHATGAENTVKLSSNENPFGPSPVAIEALG